MGIDLVSELVEVRTQILSMAANVEQRVELAIKALTEKDVAVAREVRHSDDEIDTQEVDIEAEVLRIFALTHPVASDLRFIMAVLRINNDLERIGDHAKAISKRVLHLVDCPPLGLPNALRDMAVQSKAMLHDAVNAFANEDAELCRHVRLSDDRVDELQKEIFTWALAEIPMHVEMTSAVIDILSICRALERIGDLSTNIAEDVIFIVEGATIRHSKV